MTAEITAKTVYAYALPDMSAPLAVFSSLYRFPYTQFLDSTAPQQQGGRYSTIVFQPVEILEVWGDKITVTNRDQQLSLRGKLADLLPDRLNVWGQGDVMSDPTLPPFQGGAVGYFGFGFGQLKQRVMDIPQAAFGIYDQCVSFDHQENRAWYVVISDNAEHARTKYNHFTRLASRSFLPREDSEQPHLSWAPRTLPGPLKENARRLTDYIHAGSFDRTFLCQYYESIVPAGYDVLAHYQSLRAKNRTPLGTCQMLGGLNVIVSDAEPLLTINDKQVEVHHISHRTPRPEGALRDNVAARTLAQDQNIMNAHRKMAKDQAIRLSSLCRANGILGPSNPEVIQAGHEYQVGSITRGVLNEDTSLSDLLDTFTPAPQYAGQPLERSLRVVADMESSTRGPAYGHTVVISFTGHMTVSLNTEVTVNNGHELRYTAGLPISANTEPDIWYDELVNKAEIALARIGSDTEERKSNIA